jgi:hypothetical protein
MALANASLFQNCPPAFDHPFLIGGPAQATSCRPSFY